MWFARVSSHVSDLNTRNKLLTAKLLNQDYQDNKLRKAFSKFDWRHFDLISKFSVRLKSLLQQGLSEPGFYGDLVYKFRKINACNDFSTQICKIILCYIKIRYNINVIWQTTCAVDNLITVNNFASLFGCTPQTLWQLEPKDLSVSRLVPNALALVGSTGVQPLVFFCFSISVLFLTVESSSLFQLYSFDFYVFGDNALMS